MEDRLLLRGIVSIVPLGAKKLTRQVPKDPLIELCIADPFTWFTKLGARDALDIFVSK